VICSNAALECFRGPAGAVFPALARLLSITPLPAHAFFSMPSGLYMVVLTHTCQI
jgi:hypothetical protein